LIALQIKVTEINLRFRSKKILGGI